MAGGAGTLVWLLADMMELTSIASKNGSVVSTPNPKKDLLIDQQKNGRVPVTNNTPQKFVSCSAAVVNVASQLGIDYRLPTVAVAWHVKNRSAGNLPEGPCRSAHSKDCWYDIIDLLPLKETIQRVDETNLDFCRRLNLDTTDQYEVLTERYYYDAKIWKPCKPHSNGMPALNSPKPISNTLIPMKRGTTMTFLIHESFKLLYGPRRRRVNYTVIALRVLYQ